jgi:hypothetical protein
MKRKGKWKTFAFDLAKRCAYCDGNWECLKKRSLTCAGWTGHTWEGLSEVSETLGSLT